MNRLKLIKWLLVSVSVVIMTACGGGSGGDNVNSNPVGVTSGGASDGDESGNNNHPVMKTISGVVVDDPIVGATVKVLSLNSDELQVTTTDNNGNYSVQVNADDISAGFMLEANGGVMNGVDFNDTLRAIYGASENLENANITLMTTLLTKMVTDDNSTDGVFLEKRDRALQKLFDMGMLKQEDWFKVEPSLVNMDELSALVQFNGLDAWLSEIIVDLDDSQLGREKMSVFSNVHGGISKVYISPSKFVSIFPGQEKIIIIDAEFVDTNDTNISIQKISGPDWITIQGNALLINPQSDLTIYNDFTVQLEILANDVQIGRAKNVIVSLVKKIILLSGELGAEEGKIENQWKDISLSVDANKLTQTYQIEYNAGLTNDGHLALWFKINPTMSLDEELALQLTQPNAEIIKINYLESDISSLRSINRATNNTNYASDGVPSECRPIWRDVPNKDQQEMVWTDENGDGLKFEYVWQGYAAKFNINHNSNLPLTRIGGLPRLFNDRIISINDDTPEIKCASALRSKVSDTTNIEEKEAVLFVHGFISTGKLGGYDHGGGGDDHKTPGGEYFDKFPYIVDDYKGNDVDNPKEFIPFVFQWRTNARFQDVADELARAIKQIAEKTGKKVHIMAHSFGGVLVRTLVQDLSNSPLYHGDFSEKYIASITTVGTPHSGTFGVETDIEFNNYGSVTFPEGRNGLPGYGIKECQAITCYQTGSGILNQPLALNDYSGAAGNPGYIPPDYLNKKYMTGMGSPELYGTMLDIGYITYMTYKGLSFYPNIPTQVLIGLVPESVKVRTDSGSTSYLSYDFFNDEASRKRGAGDYLISVFGQRIVPDSNQDDLNPMYEENPIIEEHILPMDGRSNRYVRGIDDWIVDEYSLTVLNDSWNIFTYRENINFDELVYFADGYNHRTGQYKANSLAITYEKYLSRQSEVGLQNCIDSKNCNNSTWNYFKEFLDLHPAEAITPPTQIKCTGSAVYSGYSVINRSINRDVSVVPFPVTIEVYTGNIFNIFSTNERTSLKDDGTYELNVTYSPDTNYTVIAYPEGDTVARIGAFVRASASKFLTTFATLEESTLHFPTITLTDDNYQEGTLTIKVTDGTSGTVLNGFDAEILNTTGINTDDNSMGINTGYISTLPKGNYAVKISKEGYNDGEAQCTVVGNETTECMINIVADSHLAEGQITAVLSWGETPRDLDSHLVRKTDGSQDYHVYYGHQTDIDANLDRDDISSYGPETITINNVNQDSVYTYYVYNFSGGAGSVLPNSGAKLELNFNGGQRTFYVPNEEGRYWKVFEIVNGRIIPCTTGCVQNDTSSIVRSLDRDAYLFQNLPEKR